MASVAQLIVKISADADGLTRGIAAAQRATLSLTEKLDAAGGALTRGLTVPLGGLAALSLRSASQFQQLERGLAAVTKEAGPLTAQLDRLKKVAELPGLGFREAVQGSINLQAAGFSANKAERALSAFGNALATVGKGRAELDGVILALSQIQSKGKVSAEEINQLAERLPQIRTALQGAFGTADTEAIQKLGLTTDQVIEKIIQQFEKLPKVTGGIGNSFENLKDRGERSLAALGEAIVPFAKKTLDALDPVIAKVGDLGKSFADLPQPVQTATLALGGILIAAGPVAKLIGYFGELRIVALKAYDALAKLLKLPFFAAAAPVAIPAAAGGAAFLFLDTLNDAATKTSTAELKLNRINDRLNETKIASAAAISGMSQFADSVFKVGEAAKVTTASGLQQALDLLKNPAASTTAKELSDALETVRAAYKRGETDLKTLSKATTDYKRDAKALGIELKELEKFEFKNLIDKALFDTLTSGWNKAAQAVVDARLSLLDLDKLKLDNLGPVAAGQAITKSFKEARASVIDLIASTTTLQANLDFNGGVPIKVQPIEVNQRKGTVLEAGDILGGQSQIKLQQQAEQAGKNLERIVQLRDQGKATQNDVIRAQAEYEEASLKAASTTVDLNKQKQKSVAALGRQISTITTDLSRSIADLIFKGGKIGDVFKTLGQDIAKSILRYAIEQGINVLIKSLGKLLGSVLDVGGAFAKVFGGAAQTAGGVASAAGGIGSAIGSVAGTAGSAGSAAAGIATSSITGVVGAVSGVVSAVVGVLSYLNSRRMEQDIGRIEVTSRGILNDLANLRRDEWDRFGQYFTRQGEILNAVRGIYDGLSQINFAGANGGSGALMFNGPVTITVSGANAQEVLKDITRQLKAQDNRFAAR